MAKLLLNPQGLAAVLHAPDGLVGRDVSRRTVAVHAAARQNCPVDTGRLRSSIRFRFVTFDGEFCGVVGTDVEYAFFVHEGTRPHVILPKSGRVLVFESGGQTVFTTRVNHPGTRGRPFLTDALAAAG